MPLDGVTAQKAGKRWQCFKSRALPLNSSTAWSMAVRLAAILAVSSCARNGLAASMMIRIGTMKGFGWAWRVLRVSCRTGRSRRHALVDGFRVNRDGGGKALHLPGG